MPYVSGFEHDLFVSYAHIDDEPDVGQRHGWVTTLKDNLRTRIDRRLGTRSDIWMDQRLVAEAELTTPIMEGLKRAAGLLVILSRAYLNSPWCQRERGGFLESLQERRMARRPVFLVECDDLDRADLPPAFGDLLSVRFWQRETEGAAPQRLGDPLPLLEDRTYWSRLNDLSFKVTEELGRLSVSAAAMTPQTSVPAVFLAEVTDDLVEQYERVQRSLEQAGFAVLPNRAYPRDTPESYASAMREDLDRCEICVQLLGEYGGRVRGWNSSLAAVQYEAARQTGKPLRQWRRFELDKPAVKDELHRELVFGADVVNESLESFIAGIAKQVTAARQPPSAPANRETMLVFVNHDQSDAEVGTALCDFFAREGLAFVQPVLHETADAMRADLEDNLKLCDGLVMVYGHSPSTWVRHQLKEALKARCVRDRPLGHVLLCHSPPDEAKIDPGLRLPNQSVIDCRRGIDANAARALAQFVSTLRG